jgi:rod shape-determining protein MreD
MRALRIILALWLAIILESVFAPAIRILGARPDFPLLVVVVVALREGPAGGALAGFVSGLFVDLNSAQPLGATSLMNGLIGFGVGSLGDRIVRDSTLARCIVALLATALRDAALGVFSGVGGFGSAWRHFFLAALPDGIYTALLAVPVMFAAERVVGWGRESGRGLS